MQGKKDYQEKLFNSFQLSERVPETNFYRRLKGVLDLHFLYKLTREYYGESGPKRKTKGQVQGTKALNIRVIRRITALRIQMLELA